MSKIPAKKTMDEPIREDKFLLILPHTAQNLWTQMS